MELLSSDFSFEVEFSSLFLQLLHNIPLFFELRDIMLIPVFYSNLDKSKPSILNLMRSMTLINFEILQLYMFET